MTTKRMLRITATVFGGRGDRNRSAYDSHVITDSEHGAGLPFRFFPPRPKVRLYANGRGVTVPIIDVGPWYDGRQGWPYDPYWRTPARPRAEGDPRTNGAGIDLTPATANLLGIDGKGIVDWEFVEEEKSMTDELKPTAGDAHCVPKLLQLAQTGLEHAQHSAARKLLAYDGEIYPRDGCAITLSELLEEAGVPIKDTYQAIALGKALEARGWKVIPVGEQKAGDVGSTCHATPRHGEDHIYLVLQALNKDEMVIADNQSHAPHFRWASGKGGKTPTTHFLRA